MLTKQSYQKWYHKLRKIAIPIQVRTHLHVHHDKVPLNEQMNVNALEMKMIDSFPQKLYTAHI